MVWEFVMENNRPSSVDSLTTIIGGIPWGEILYRISNDLLVKQNSSGLERILRETAVFVITPVIGFNRFITGRTFRKSPSSPKHSYDFQVPLGIFGRNPMLAIHLKYKDALEKEDIRPYDYFTFDLQLRGGRKIIEGAEVFTSGLILGKKLNFSSGGRGLLGLFGEYDYLDSPEAGIGKMSAMGLGPGWTANYDFASKFFLHVSGILSGIIGGTTSSFALKYGGTFFDSYEKIYEFNRHGGSWHFGPGASARLNLEFGRNGLGSISTRFSQYWLRSIFIKTGEFLSVLALDLNYDLSRRVRLNIGVDHYWRNATYRDFLLREKTPFLHSSVVFRF